MDEYAMDNEREKLPSNNGKMSRGKFHNLMFYVNEKKTKLQ